MTDLQDHQFEILDEDAGSGYVFGLGCEVSMDEDGFSPASGDWIVQDGQNSRRGNTAFGRDVLGGGTWTFDTFVDQETKDDALDVLDRFSAAWRNEARSLIIGDVQVLRYRVGERVRRVYGRPRRFAAPPSNMILSGYVPVTHDFACTDSNTYDDVEQSISVSLTSTTDATLRFPMTFPIQATPPGESNTIQAVVGGNVRAYPVIRFNGPWINPTLIAPDWTLKLTTSLAVGQWVEVDTRPWALTILRNDGASLAGALQRGTWLEDVFLNPSSRIPLQVGGSAPGGATACVVKWRNAWAGW